MGRQPDWEKQLDGIAKVTRERADSSEVQSAACCCRMKLHAFAWQPSLSVGSVHSALQTSLGPSLEKHSLSSYCSLPLLHRKSCHWDASLGVTWSETVAV